VNKKIAAMKNQPEGQREKDDHTTDALRYLMTFMPDLTPQDYDGSAEDKYEYAQDYIDVAYTWRTELQRRNSEALGGWTKVESGGSTADFTGME
jgi:hypothetical protein